MATFLDPTHGSAVSVAQAQANPSAYRMYDANTGASVPIASVIANPSAYRMLDLDTGRVASAAAFFSGGSITLGTVTLSGSLTQGTPASGVTLSGLTDGSSVAFNIGGLSVPSTSGSSRSVTGTPSAFGALNVVETLVGATNSPNTTNNVATVAASSAVTFSFPAVQTKMAAGQRAQIAVVGDSAVAGWGSGVTVGTGSGSNAGSPPNYLRNKSWIYQLKDQLVARGVPCRADAYFSSQVDSVIANMVAANPNIQVGTGWTLSNYSLSGTMLTCSNTVSTASIFTPEIAADTFDIIHSAQSGLGTITFTDADGMNVSINTGSIAGAQVTNTAGTLGLKRTTITRAAATTTPVNITRSAGNSIFIVAIIPYNSTSPALELLNMGWPSSKAYGTSGSGHWNIYSDPTTMGAATPYNALGALNSDAYIIELGTNDQAGGVLPADFQTAMTNIASKLKGQAGNNGLNVALVKCRTTIGGYASYNMSPDMLAVIDTVTTNLSLAPVIDYNSIAFTTTTDRFDGTHLSTQGYGKETNVARVSLIGS